MSETVNLNEQFYCQNSTDTNVNNKKPPIPLPRKKSNPDVFNDTNLHIVQLSSDDDSSISQDSQNINENYNIDTDLSDIESPKQIQRSGTFTKFDKAFILSKPKTINDSDNENSKSPQNVEFNGNENNDLNDNTEKNETKNNLFMLKTKSALNKESENISNETFQNTFTKQTNNNNEYVIVNPNTIIDVKNSNKNIKNIIKSEIQVDNLEFEQVNESGESDSHVVATEEFIFQKTNNFLQHNVNTIQSNVNTIQNNEKIGRDHANTIEIHNTETKKIEEGSPQPHNVELIESKESEVKQMFMINKKSAENIEISSNTLPVISSVQTAAESTDYSEDKKSISIQRKKKKKKILKKSKPHSDDIEMKIIPVSPLKESNPNDNAFLPNEQEDKIVCLSIHESDILLTDGLVSKPMIEVHFVNKVSGQYLTKSTLQPGDGNRYIGPMQTQVFDFHANRSISPRWEEQLFIPESPTYIFSPETLVLFEIIDRNTRIRPQSLYTKLGSTTSYRVAWAFLKLIGANHVKNVNKKLRLQLYKPKYDLRSTDETVPLVFKWFTKFEKCTKLKNSLYITIRDIMRPSPLSPTSKSKIDLGAEIESLRSNNLSLLTQPDDGSKFMNEKRINQWSKLPGESCKIPNTKLMTLYGGSDGALAIKFSPNGIMLAVAQYAKLSVYNIPEGYLVKSYNAHNGLIYSVIWSEDNTKLMSTSADRTVCVWYLNEKTEPMWILPHPCYVYDAIFLFDFIVTGCFDGVVRVWRSESELIDELNGHKGYVNSICYNYFNSVLYTGDSQGVIIAWRFNEKNKRWHQERTILINGLKGVVINTIILYGRSSLIVHTQDSLLRMIDVTSGVILHWYKGCLNDSIKTGCIISPCRSLLFCASEDSSVYVWDCHTGNLKGIYLSLGKPGPIALSYHPFDHILAVSLYIQQSNPPVLLFSYSRGESGKNIRLHLVAESKEQDMKQFVKEKINKDLSSNHRKISLLSGTSSAIHSDHLDDKLSEIIRKMDRVLKSVS